MQTHRLYWAIYTLMWIEEQKAKIYNGEKTIPLTSVAGKTGQPPGKEWN